MRHKIEIQAERDKKGGKRVFLEIIHNNKIVELEVRGTRSFLAERFEWGTWNSFIRKNKIIELEVRVLFLAKFLEWGAWGCKKTNKEPHKRILHITVDPA